MIDQNGYICLAHRCGLCRMRLRPGDHVNALDDDGQFDRSFVLGPKLTHSMMLQRPVRIDKKRITYGVCGLPCKHEHGQVAVYHEECVELDVGVSVPELIRAGRYNFEPSSTEETQRLASFEKDIVSAIRSCQPRLPAELSVVIAQMSLQFYPLGRIAKYLRNSRSVANSFRLDKPVLASYIDFEGQRYIRSLFNGDVTDSSYPSEIVFDPYNKTHVGSVFVSMDYRGIREVLFVTVRDETSRTQKEGIWWKCLELQGQTTIFTETDGVKLSNIRVETHGPVLVDLLWPTTDIYRLHHHSFVNPSLDRVSLPELSWTDRPRRMQSIRLDHPETIGYSFCTGLRVLTMHAHTQGEGDISLYRDITDKCTFKNWVYVPMEPDEVFTEVWTKDRTNSSDYPLVVVTSKSRVYWLSTCEEDIEQPWRLLHRSQKGPRQIFFEMLEDAPYGIHNLAFDLYPDESPSSVPLFVRNEPPMLWDRKAPNSMLLSYHDEYNTFYSIASLENVTEVTPCRLGSHPSIRGLLLTYRDGHKERLGEVRLDSLIAPIELAGSSNTLYLSMSDSGQVLGCAINEQPTEAGDDYLDIPFRGEMEWWFSPWAVQIYHEGRKSFINGRS